MRKGWFGPRRIGWGVGPRSWEGWVVTVVFIGLVAASMRWLRPLLETRTGLPTPAVGLAIIAAWLAIYLSVIWLTFDRSDGRS